MFGFCTQAGVDFATAPHFELTNAYQNLLQVSVAAPSKGFIVLTGSGYIELVNPDGAAWAGISIGTVPGVENSAQTGVQVPLSAPVAGTYRLPFSLTTVVPVSRGRTVFYMVGIKDPNAHACYANGLCLTALFVKNKV